MTEQEWLNCTDPTPMLDFLREQAGDRKLRLFAVGCCRLIWDRLVCPASREAVIASEAFADGRGSDDDLTTLNHRAEGAAFGIDSKEERYRREQRGIVRGWLREEDGVEAAGVSGPSGVCVSFHEARTAASAAEHAASSIETFLTYTDPSILSEQLVRCIFGNPFQPVTADTAWLTSDVVALAHGIYDEKGFDRMPILADALQDAGCDNDAVLNHCRGDGPHCRGCWIVDLILGKE
ncbi:MAG TPA: hypothetical protein VGE74_00085 [Gemmata sp.]